MKKYKTLIIIAAVVLGGFAIDLITKTIANNNLAVYEKNPIINKFFYLTLCYNTGGAWSIFSGNVPMLIVFSVIALGLVILTMMKSNSKFYIYSSAVFIGGLIGNLFDRIVYGKVIDFLDFIIFGYDFPVFNVADCFICIGVALMAIALIKEEKNNGKVSD
jgi:signal peptidase II